MPSYKRTEVGKLPEDWKVRSIESLTPPNRKYGIVDGPFGSNLKTIHYRKSGIPIITSGYVTEGKFNADDYLYVDEGKFKQEIRSAVKGGDIVMAKIGARCGASAILPWNHQLSILSGNALKISIDEKNYSTFYVWQILWNLYVDGDLERIRTTGAQPAISISALKKLHIPLPPNKAEQEAVANALRDADALIGSLEQVLTKKRDLKQGTMQEMLTGKMRLPGFSGEWARLAFGEVAKVRNNKITTWRSPLAEFCVELEQIGQNTGQLEGFNDVRNRKATKYVFHPNDVLFGRLRSYLRKFWLANRDGVCSTEIWPLIPSGDKLFSGFLHQIVQTDAFIEVANAAYGTHMPRADWSAVCKHVVNLPEEIAEQIAIARTLSDMDAEIVALEAKTAKVRQIKQGMMQELLTGRIRLV